MFSYSEFIHNYTLSQFRHVEPLSADYTVRVNGQEVPVYTCRISKFPFNTVWPDHQREINQTELASFVNLVSDEALSVEVIPSRPFGRAFVKPYSRNVVTDTTDGVIRFTLTENGGFVLGLDDMHHCLYLFNGKPIDAPDPKTVTHYFGPGIHMPGKIVLHSGDRVYADKDALIYGCLYAEDQENIEIFGNGIFDDSSEERFSMHCYENYTVGNIKMYDCKNVSVRGVGFRNSAIWCLNVFHGTDITFDGVNVFGQWRYNTDGCDIMNSQNILLRGCFIHSFDDTVSIKGIQRYRHSDNQNIRIEHCVLWCDWGKACTLGIETYAPRYRDIVFRDCDILRGGNNACDIQNGNGADIGDVLFEDIRIEVDSFYTQGQYQVTDDELYALQDTVEIPRIFNIENYPYNSDEFGVYAEPLIDKVAVSVHDVTARGIQVYYDGKIPLKNGKYPTPIHIRSTEADVRFDHILLENFTVNEEKITPDKIEFVLEGTDHFQMK